MSILCQKMQCESSFILLGIHILENDLSCYEMGMLISAVGRGNVAILKKGHIEIPSDANGILYIPFNEHVKETVPKLTDRLRAAGFVLNPSAITNASS